MKTADRQKMCSNCNGRVAYDAAECPYCAMEFPEIEKNESQTPLFKNQSIQDSLSSLYKPPYSNKTLEKPAAAASPRKEAVFKEPASPVINTTAAVNEEEKSEDSKAEFWALFALIVAGNLLTIGLLQFFFSDKGYLRLEWDSSYWYLYCLISAPLFYFGLKKAKEV